MTQKNIQPHTNIFEIVIPSLKSNGLTDEEIDLLLKVNPVKTFSIGIKEYSY